MNYPAIIDEKTHERKNKKIHLKHLRIILQLVSIITDITVYYCCHYYCRRCRCWDARDCWNERQRHSVIIHRLRTTVVRRENNSCASGCRPSLKFLLNPQKYWVQFFICFQSFTETKLLASSLLCCSISTLVLMGNVRCVTLCFMSGCVILHEMSWNKNNQAKPSLKAKYNTSGIIQTKRTETHVTLTFDLWPWDSISL